MPSKKAFSADNPQERKKFLGWIVGFTDGEGCFSVSFNKNKTTSSGWQIFPEFVITQGEKSLSILEKIQRFFKCGKIFINRRKDNHKENLYRYCVRSISDLSLKIIPFFKANPLETAKQRDFKQFVLIIDMMLRQEHLRLKGMKKIALLVSKMNRKIPSRFLSSPETIRRTILR